MTTIVVDTSAVIAVINGEPEKDRLIELTKETSIVAPPSIDWEIGNAFSAMLKQSRISLSQAVEVVNIYQEIDLEILEIDLIEALKLAGKLKIYAYDAYILQCAIEYDLPLIALDKNLRANAKKLGINLLEV